METHMQMQTQTQTQTQTEMDVDVERRRAPLGSLPLLFLILAAAASVASGLPLNVNTDTDTNNNAVPSLEFGALAPALIAALFLITVVLLLGGCVCCRRNKFTQFTNSGINDLPELVGTASVQIGNVSSSPIDTGIVNPIADREFTIFGPLAPDGYPRPQLANLVDSPEFPRIAHQPFYNPPDVENNNPPFENNNGPISPQELENIVNNNAENYIVSEYENRNLNESVTSENVIVEDPQTSCAIPTVIHEPPRDFGDELKFARFESHKDWFENADREFPRNQLQYLREIGRGWFGRIVEADAHNFSLQRISPNDSSVQEITKVAVKILDENVSFSKKCNFLDECKLYRDASHENILKLLGTSLCQDPWLILFEYCALGDLKTFLQKNATNKATLTSQGIPLKFQYEIASAVSYLHSVNVIHPDIACHSCMVMEGLTTKLGDYGGSKSLHPSDFYNLTSDKFIPLRWLAPECVQQPITKEGNVWSFGIFLWESCSWGALPYDMLNNEQVISNVLCQNGIRLPQPHLVPDYFSYIYQIMQSCWQYNSADRITSERILSLLHQIYSNYFDPFEKRHHVEKSLDDFEARWQVMKPNTIPKVDNGQTITTVEESEVTKNTLNLPECSYGDSGISNKYDTESISTMELNGSTEALIESYADKVKSDSLTNLHGSLESVCDKNIVEIDRKETVDESDRLLNTDTPLGKSTSDDACVINPYNCEVAPWLQDLPVTSQEDMSYIKTVSDVISDLDNMLSSEKTSSSESSHQTSPSRDVSNNTVSCDKDALCPSYNDIILEYSDNNVNNQTSNLMLINNSNSASNASKNTNTLDQVNSPQKVPESSDIQSTIKQDFYPTLDFRLAKLENTYDETSEVHPIFQTKYINTGQDYDSLQDSSYLPTDSMNTKADELNDSQLVRQSSSGSETEDEIWKKRIEIGALTEKIKLKSKSVTDFMVLTHIDMDFTDLDSEDTSFTSDSKHSIVSSDKLKKKFKNDLPPKESSLPVVEYLSFPKNYQFSALSHNEIISRPTIDICKLKKNLLNATLRNLRPTKSFDDLTSVQPKNISVKDLLLFKKDIDNFLCDKIVTDDSTNFNETLIDDNYQNLMNEDMTEYLHLDKLSMTIVPSMPVENAKTSSVTFNLYDSQSPNGPFVNFENSTSTPIVDEVVSPVIDSSNTMQQISSFDKNVNSSFSVGSTAAHNFITDKNTTTISNIERDSTSVKSISGVEYSISKLDQISVDEKILKQKSDQIKSNPVDEASSNVVLGPFYDCTLDLYTGIKTDFKDSGQLPEEETLMFSSNFNEAPLKDESSSGNIPNMHSNINSSYFFNRSSVPFDPDPDKPIDYSIDTWDRFLGSSFESNSQNFDSIFPDMATQSEDSSSFTFPDPPEAINEHVVADESIDDGNIDILNLATNNQPLNILLQNDLNNLTSKLAIAENENNLNIENSNPLLSEDIEDVYDDHMENDVNEELSNSNDGDFLNADVPIDDANLASPMENCNGSDNAPQGWFLHIKGSKDPEKILPNEQNLRSFDDDDSSEMLESMEDNKVSVVDRLIDPESVKALRNELELKLPLAQKMAQENINNEKPRKEDITKELSSQLNEQNSTKTVSENRTEFNPTHQRSSEYNCSKNIFTEQDIPKPNDAQIPRNEVLIHYNMYGVIPLSPIQEESWSEFSDLIKVGEFEKSDTSNSLSLGQLNSIVATDLPLDKDSVVDNGNQKKSDDTHKAWSDDDTNDDSHGSNQTFVALDGFDSCHPEKRKSISIDSLNCIEDQMELDGEPEPVSRPKEMPISDTPIHDPQISELLSPFYEDHSTTKSTEEISQNLDNLLENITKTLENASKVGSVSSECVLLPDGVVEAEEPSQIDSIASVETDSASHTYIVEGKNVANDVTYICPTKVLNVPDDVSNVSKISQPSLVSDINTSNMSESQLKPSERSSQILHTKTASMDSWCSNDTLFNVEENFDDICSLNDFPESPIDKCIDGERRSVTPTIADNPLYYDKNIMDEMDENYSCRPSFSLEGENLPHPPMEMVMNYPTNRTPIMANSSDLNNQVLTLSCGDNNMSLDESPVKLPSPKMNSISENVSYLLPNSSDSNGTSFSEKSGIELISVILKDSPEKSPQPFDDNKQIALDLPKVTETEMLSPKIISDAEGTCSTGVVTSTPLFDLNTQGRSNMSQDSIDSAQIMIDAQFEFLDNIDGEVRQAEEAESNLKPPSSEDSPLSSKVWEESPILNFVSVDQGMNHYKNICNITDKFIEMERHMPYDDLNRSKADHPHEAFTISVNASKSNEINDINQSMKEPMSMIQFDANTPDSAPTSISYSDFLQSVEMKDQDLTTFENQSIDDVKDTSSKLYGEYDSALMEYVGHSGLDMSSVDDVTPSFSYQDVKMPSFDYSNVTNLGLVNTSSNDSNLFTNSIHFSGPINESSSDGYYSRHVKDVSDINTIPPECLKDWDSGSEESNGNSSSSGEFTWKKGDTEESIVLSASLCTSANLQRNVEPFSMSRDYDTIPEEISASDESADASADEEEVDFIPSSWDYLAIPSKSALKSPDSSQSESRKKVAFKKQKYHCVYEYPREVVECEIDSPHLAGCSSYTDWQTYCHNESDPQYDKFIESCPNDLDLSCPVPSGVTVPDDDFYISSSTAPFESYSFLNSSSQFFPGQHLSLLNNNAEFDDIDEPLPPLPPELLEYNTDYTDDMTNMISNILANSQSRDFVTPDSGTEDVTPGSLVDYEFKDVDVKSAIEDLKSVGDVEVEAVKTNGSLPSNLSDQELSLNLSNKIRSLANCSTLQLVNDKGSPSGSLTPSTPSPSAVGSSSQSSGSTSPLQLSSSVLGGLRHTRDKLKLDLPPSPLARNSPTTLSSGKNSNGELKIFDFKLESDIEPSASNNNECENKTPNDTVNNSESLDLANKNQVFDDIKNEFKIDLEKFKAYESLDSNSPLSPLEKINISTHQQDLNDAHKQASSIDSLHSDPSMLHKAVVPINMDETSKKSHLEPVKGEGTLLDSGDEDSGIGSSAYTTLERKIEHIQSDNDFISASR
ncbi:uncharacterized protein LOC143921179 [Arctopsyche grandis]|uniref:uncharacterized protein LOC143921179 n=1 Tax=Arctopsyche grandis TaxID=121162 RepID=UPI00406D6DA7